jgi:hypothetical protein
MKDDLRLMEKVMAQDTHEFVTLVGDRGGIPTMQ